MVLDEDALEAMLQRQKQAAANAEAKDTKQIELTDKTEEFEVYEREPGTTKTGPGLHAGTPLEEPDSPVLPEAFQEPMEAEPEPVVDPTPEPEPIPEPIPEPQAPVHEKPEPVEEALPVRPRVWPPLSSSKNVEAPAAPVVHAPEIVAEPEAEPEVVAEPEPIPDPVPEIEDEPTLASSDSEDPHAHAHAALNVNGGGVRIAIIQALFNQDITDMMTDLAVAKAKKRGAKVSHQVTVPGVYDLPLITARLLERDDVDCAVVIGVVIKGETGHDDLITHSTARTLQQLSLDLDKPIGLGITGPGMTWKQAEARVANGAHAVDAALSQVAALKSL